MKALSVQYVTHQKCKQDVKKGRKAVTNCGQQARGFIAFQKCKKLAVIDGSLTKREPCWGLFVSFNAKEM